MVQEVELEKSWCLRMYGFYMLCIKPLSEISQKLYQNHEKHEKDEKFVSSFSEVEDKQGYHGVGRDS